MQNEFSRPKLDFLRRADARRPFPRIRHWLTGAVDGHRRSVDELLFEQTPLVFT